MRRYTSKMDTHMRGLMDSLVASLPAAKPDPLQDIRELFGDPACCLERADDKGCWLQDGEGSRRVEFPGGLTQKLYLSLSKSLTEDEKFALAMGVVRNAMSPINPRDWQLVEGFLQQQRAPEGHDHAAALPALVESTGFTSVVEGLRRRLAEFRKRTPRRRLRVAVVETPRWDGQGGILTFADMAWKIRVQDGPVTHLLAELERRGWPPSVHLTYLDPDQVREAARGLRKRTDPAIHWHAAVDGVLSWSIS
jgi:hypothetical protein